MYRLPTVSYVSNVSAHLLITPSHLIGQDACCGRSKICTWRQDVPSSRIIYRRIKCSILATVQPSYSRTRLSGCGKRSGSFHQFLLLISGFSMRLYSRGSRSMLTPRAIRYRIVKVHTAVLYFQLISPRASKERLRSRFIPDTSLVKSAGSHNHYVFLAHDGM